MGLSGVDAGKQFIEFVNQTGSPYHTVAECVRLLEASGFTELRDESLWSIKNGGKYFVTKGDSDIMGFVVGEKFNTEGYTSGGFSMVGAHTDSPCLRIRPNSKTSSAGMLQVGVHTYGGGLWHTWFDRPLGFAGKVIVRDGDHLKEKLIHVKKPVLLLPNLAIHLQTAEERKAFNVNPETHLQPVLCSKSFDDKNAGGRTEVDGKHHMALLEIIAEEANVAPGDIVDVDVCLMDSFPSCLVGRYEEFISSPRIDNCLSTWAAVKAICTYASDAQKIAESQEVCLMVAFDHEECGSQSSVGADGATLPTWCGRILTGLSVGVEMHPSILARSFLVSADCAHAVHPNYGEKHQKEHRAELNMGIVIKTNPNQRYATSVVSASLFREVCLQASVPVQEFVVRNDSPCGTTIGPIISSTLGVRSLDIGAGQWAMHSCRESCAASDAAHLTNACSAFYATFRAVDNAMKPAREP